jgi:hypothetical protein
MEWHIRDVRNSPIVDIDGDVYHMLDGVEDWIRHSMELRALSEKALRKTQLENGWSNEELVRHLRGDCDGDGDLDEEIYDRLRYNGCEAEAYKFIPKWRLKEIDPRRDW